MKFKGTIGEVVERDTDFSISYGGANNLSLNFLVAKDRTSHADLIRDAVGKTVTVETDNQNFVTKAKISTGFLSSETILEQSF